MDIQVVTIIGANGAMGSTAAGIFAAFGRAKVYMVCRDYDKAYKAVDRAVDSVKAESIRENLIPKSFDEIDECIKNSQWIFESTKESYEVKLEINKSIAQYRKPGTIVSTGTSGLSIEKLKEAFDEEGKKLYFGTHFFNPPYSLPLCELIVNKDNEQQDIEDVYNYLKNILKRKVVKTKDRPAFLANRVGFQFLNNALQKAEEYQHKGGIDYIDAIFGGFTGRGMSPLNTIDFVGLDIHKAIVDNIYENTEDLLHNTFSLPQFCQELIQEGKLGRKVREGLFKLHVDELGNKSRLVYDISSKTYRKVLDYKFEYADKMINYIRDGRYSAAISVLLQNTSEEAQICRELLIKHIIYALNVLEEVGDKSMDVEVAMVYGFNWISPLALLNLMGGAKQIIKFIEQNPNLVKELHGLDFERFISQYEKISYEEDYRKALKAHY